MHVRSYGRGYHCSLSMHDICDEICRRLINVVFISLHLWFIHHAKHFFSSEIARRVSLWVVQCYCCCGVCFVICRVFCILLCFIASWWGMVCMLFEHVLRVGGLTCVCFILWIDFSFGLQFPACMHVKVAASVSWGELGGNFSSFSRTIFTGAHL